MVWGTCFPHLPFDQSFLGNAHIEPTHFKEGLPKEDWERHFSSFSTIIPPSLLSDSPFSSFSCPHGLNKTQMVSFLLLFVFVATKYISGLFELSKLELNVWQLTYAAFPALSWLRWRGMGGGRVHMSPSSLCTWMLLFLSTLVPHSAKVYLRHPDLLPAPLFAPQ